MRQPLAVNYYAIQYDYREFYAVTDNRNFRVALLGNPFPSLERWRSFASASCRSCKGQQSRPRA